MEKLKQWFGKKSSALTDKAKKFTGYEDTKKFSTDTKEIAGTLLSPKKAIASARNETFNEAMKRLGVNEEDLKMNYRNFAWLCWISLAFAVFLISLATYCVTQGSSLQGLAGLSIASFCLASAFKYSFRAFQIRHQNLCSVKTWYERKPDWLPNPFL